MRAPAEQERVPTTVTTAASLGRTGRIDVHAHLLPGVDDGCKTVDESLACGRRLVAAGYAHAFCTPHVWPDLPHNTVERIPARVADLQRHLDAAGVRLKLFPGGELSLRPEMPDGAAETIVSYGMRRRFVLFDIWVDRLPAFFKPAVRWLQSAGVTALLAHPERMRAVQLDPGLVRLFTDELGLRLQGNLQCFSDPVGTPTRTLAERFIRDGAYFVLGTDLHNPQSMDVRLNGLTRAIEVVGDAEVDRLTIDHPREILRDVL